MIESARLNFDNKVEREEDVKPESIAIATSTYYPSFGEGASDSVDNVRGELALNFFRQAKNDGYNVVVVDGNSSNTWKEKLQEFASSDFIVEEQTEKGLSASRRQAMITASKIPNVLVVAESEPEKIDIVNQAKKLAFPIVGGEVGVVVPDRGEKGMKNYSPVQRDSELQANSLLNSIMKERGIVPENDKGLDWFIGVRFIKNDPEILGEFLKERKMNGEGKLFKISNPGDWSDAMYTPLVDILNKDPNKVKSVEIKYEHPVLQTATEINDPKFDKKRDIQFKSIVTNVIEEVRNIENNPNKPSKLEEI